MVETVNHLKRLGKCFFFPIETTKGFEQETLLRNQTCMMAVEPDSGYNPLAYVRVKEFLEGKRDNLKINKPGYLAKRTLVRVGEDYDGPLELPKGTEVIEIFDLKKDGSQVIHYCHTHRGSRGDDKLNHYIPFANEMRSPDKAVDVVL